MSLLPEPPTDPQTSAAPAAAEPEGWRRCIVTGESQPRERMIRFVVGPDGQVWPDLLEKLPGRGLWVGCDAGLLREAIRKNLFSKAAHGPAKASADLTAQVAALLRERFLQLLGLAKRSGIMITGMAQVEPALAQGQIALLLIAGDAGTDGPARLAAKLPAKKIMTLLTAEELGRALGQLQLVYIGLKAHALTTQIAAAAARFSAFDTKENVAPAAAMAQIGAALADAEK